MERKRTLKPRPGASRCPEQRRLMLHGAASLATVELMACVLGGPAATRRAIAVLEGAGGLRALEHAEPWQIHRAPGARSSDAAAIVAAVELGRQLGRLRAPYARTIRGPDDVAELLRASIGPASQESFLVIGLDVRRRLRAIRTVAVGSLAHVNVHPREVFRPLVQAGMDAVILAHNHPSGEPIPSDEDVLLTHRMGEVGRLLGIPVLDHIIVTRTRVVSMGELGVLEPAFG